MKLYGSYTSPYVRHCRIALDELNVSCEFIETDYAQSARMSPNMKVPFLQDGDIELTDSTSILFHLYKKSERSFIASSEEMDVYTMANTLMDSAINQFLLERMDEMTPESSKYLARQASRVESGLEALENSKFLSRDDFHIALTRLACFLDWGLFRERISLTDKPNLQALLTNMKDQVAFKNTALPV